MAVKELIPRHTYEEITYELKFHRKDCLDSWAGFPCDRNGNLSMNVSDDGKIPWVDNYLRAAENAEGIYEPPVVEKITREYREPAYVECDCGERFFLQGDTECPKCGKLYNAFGQELESLYGDPEIDGYYDPAEGDLGEEGVW